MGKKWKRMLVQSRKQDTPAPAPAPVVSNATMVEEMKAAVEPEVVEEEAPALTPVSEYAAAVEPEPDAEAPKPKRKRARRRKTKAED